MDSKTLFSNFVGVDLARPPAIARGEARVVEARVVEARVVEARTRPDDDARPEEFVAFHFDGRAGERVDPGVRRQPAFPLSEPMVFADKQGRVHACIAVDFISAFGAYPAVPLVPVSRRWRGDDRVCT